MQSTKTRCPNPRCNEYDPTPNFCNTCGTALRTCSQCDNSRQTSNRGDAFYCRFCGKPFGWFIRKNSLLSRINLHSDSLPNKYVVQLGRRIRNFRTCFTGTHLWILTYEGELKLVHTLSKKLETIEIPAELQQQISSVEPLTQPMQVITRLAIIGKHQLLSFSIHPHRWLKNIEQTPVPENLSVTYACEGYIEEDNLFVPAYSNQQQAVLLRLGETAVEPLYLDDGKHLLLFRQIIPNSAIYWAKDAMTKEAKIVKLTKQGIKVLAENLRYEVFPEALDRKVFCVSSEGYLLEITLPDKPQLKKIIQVGGGISRLKCVRNKIVIAKHEELLFYEHPGGIERASDISTSYLFEDSQGLLLVLCSDGKLLLIDPSSPLERRLLGDASSDDSNVVDAFAVNNSLYTVSENGEVCRFDF